MEENRFWAAFGVTPPQEESQSEGAREQEPADPAAQTTEEGAKEQEPADPAERNTVEEEPEPSEEAESQEKMSEEERHRQAAMRREKERRDMEAEIRSRVQEEHRVQMESMLDTMNLKDPDTGEKVTTLEGYKAYQDKVKTAKLSRELKAGQLTPEGLETAILQSPKIAQLVENAEKDKMAAFQAQRETQLAEIRKMNANIKTLEDITRMDTGPEFIRYVGQGMDYLSAYRLANFDDITKRARAAGEQAARNGAASKAHMQSTTTGGTNPGSVEVTNGLRERYRRFNPNVTDEQIAAMEKRLRK